MKLTHDNILAGIILLAMGVLMVTSAMQDSATVDERAHIPAAYSYLKFKDMRLNPEHPPLLKDIAGFPLQFLDITFDTAHPDWVGATDDKIVGQWAIGSVMLYEWGNDPDQILFWSRLGPILLTLLLGWYVYQWTNDVAGRPYGLLGLILFAFSPTMLAHGRLVTTDIAAALGFVTGIYYFVRWLKHNTAGSLIIAGIAFGVATLLKFSTFMLIPFLLLLAGLWVALAFEWAFLLPFLVLGFWVGLGLIGSGAHNYPELGMLWTVLKLAVLFGTLGKTLFIIWKSLPRLEELMMKWLNVGVKTFAVFLIGYIGIVVPVYAFHIGKLPVERQLRDTAYLLSSFSDGPVVKETLNPPFKNEVRREAVKRSCFKFERVGRCAAELTVWSADKPLLRPFSYYMLGLLMVIQRGAGGNITYLLGEVTNMSWGSYFPLMYLMKEQLVFHVLTLLALGAFALRLRSNTTVVAARPDSHVAAKTSLALHRVRTWMRDNFDLVSLALFVFIYFYISIQGNLNIGVRHLIPAITMLYVLVAVGIARWLERAPLSTHPHDGRIASHTRLLGEELMQSSRATQKSVVVFALFAFYIATPLAVYPHFLSYYNVLGGGTREGYRVAADSNYDWGQDLKRLAVWVEEKNIDHIGVHYFGGGKPEHYIKNARVSWWWDIERLIANSKGHIANAAIPEYFAVSASFAQYANGTPIQGFDRKFEPWFPWVQGKTPVDRIGHSIFIYKLDL